MPNYCYFTFFLWKAGVCIRESWYGSTYSKYFHFVLLLYNGSIFMYHIFNLKIECLQGYPLPCESRSFVSWNALLGGSEWDEVMASVPGIAFRRALCWGTLVSHVCPYRKKKNRTENLVHAALFHFLSAASRNRRSLILPLLWSQYIKSAGGGRIFAT